MTNEQQAAVISTEVNHMKYAISDISYDVWSNSSHHSLEVGEESAAKLLSDRLPLPAVTGETGWPWETSETSAPTRATNSDLPKISVITPSFNQGEFIERTVRSVLLQNYPNLEYIIVDGGSTDGTLDVIGRYGRWLSDWTSEPDRGQSHAINKGFSRASGQILCWLNSDDFFLPNTLAVVAGILSGGSSPQVIAGHCLKIYESGAGPVLLKGGFKSRKDLLKFWQDYEMHQPAIFWRREVFEKIGWLDESLHLAMDFDYWVRASKHFQVVNVNRVLACCTFHAAAKTGDDYAAYHQELKKVAQSYWGVRETIVFWASMAKARLMPWLGRRTL